MRLQAGCIFTFALLVTTALANTEKTVFVAPAAETSPDALLSLAGQNLKILSIDQPSLRTALPVTFPSETNPQGLDSWYLLQGLNPDQRHEVRICWAAAVRIR